MAAAAEIPGLDIGLRLIEERYAGDEAKRELASELYRYIRGARTDAEMEGSGFVVTGLMRPFNCQLGRYLTRGRDATDSAAVHTGRELKSKVDGYVKSAENTSDKVLGTAASVTISVISIAAGVVERAGRWAISQTGFDTSYHTCDLTDDTHSAERLLRKLKKMEDQGIDWVNLRPSTASRAFARAASWFTRGGK